MRRDLWKAGLEIRQEVRAAGALRCTGVGRRPLSEVAHLQAPTPLTLSHCWRRCWWRLSGIPTPATMLTGRLLALSCPAQGGGSPGAPGLVGEQRRVIRNDHWARYRPGHTRLITSLRRPGQGRCTREGFPEVMAAGSRRVSTSWAGPLCRGHGGPERGRGCRARGARVGDSGEAGLGEVLTPGQELVPETRGLKAGRHVVWTEPGQGGQKPEAGELTHAPVGKGRVGSKEVGGPRSPSSPSSLPLQRAPPVAIDACIRGPHGPQGATCLTARPGARSRGETEGPPLPLLARRHPSPEPLHPTRRSRASNSQAGGDTWGGGYTSSFSAEPGWSRGAPQMGGTRESGWRAARVAHHARRRRVPVTSGSLHGGAQTCLVSGGCSVLSVRSFLLITVN